MLSLFGFLLASAALLFPISHAHPFTLTTNTTFPRIEAVHCGVGPYTPQRRNPNPVDCLTVAALIIATTGHAQILQFERRSIWEPIFSRRIGGTCEIYLSLPNSLSAISSYDEVLRAVLKIVGTCLLNQRPEQENWGGAATVGVALGLKVGVFGVAVQAGDETGRGHGTTIERIAQS